MPDSAADIERQIEYYLRKYELAPHSRAFAPLADLYRKAGRVDEALEILAAGLAEHPQYVSALVINGRSHLDAGHADAAVRSFRRVLELDPDNLVALKQLAALALGADDAAAARDLLARVVVLDPTDEASASHLEALRAPAAPTEPSPLTGPLLVPGAKSGEAPVAADPNTAPAEPAPRLEPAAAAPEEAAPEPEPAPVPRVEPEAAQAAAVTAAAEEPAAALEAPAPQPAAAPAPEPGGEGAGETPDAGGRESLVTKTLAEIYLAQGYRDKALQVLRQILARHPERADVRAKLAELEAAPPSAPPASPPAVEASSGSANRRHFETWLQRLGRPEETE